MRTSMQTFSLFESFLEKYDGPCRSFGDLCGMAGISAADMEEILVSELGMSGEEVVAHYFGNGDKND